MEKYTKLWDEIKYIIETINGGKSGECGKDFMKIKMMFNSDDNIPLNKQLKFNAMAIIIRSDLKKIVNIIHKFFYTNVCMSYKNVVMQKNLYLRRNWY